MAQHTFTRALSTGSLAFLVALAPIATPAFANDHKQILAGIHTDAIAADINGDELELFTYADLPGARHTKLDSSNVIFHLPTNDKTQVKVPKGFEFIAAEGTQVWFAPQTQHPGVLWPGWNTEDIARGEVKDDSLVMELMDAKTPEGGSVEVFQDSAFGAPTRIWSSDEDVKKYVQAVASHVHANWAFTHEGTYSLDFKVSGELVDGTPVEATQTYTFIVGDLPSDKPSEDASEKPAEPKETEEPAPSESAAPSQEPAPAPSHTEDARPADPAPVAPAPAEPVAPQEEAPAQKPYENCEAVWNDLHGPISSNHPRYQPKLDRDGDGTGCEDNPQGKGNDQAPQAPAQNNRPAQATQPQQVAAPEKCMATEELIEQAPAQAKRASSSKDAVFKTTANKAPTLKIVTATNSSRQQLNEGHFDFGALLKGDQLQSSIKDDRTSPAQWVVPSSVEFVLNDAAKKKMPAGMDHIAPAGSDVYLIGGTQEAGVPWLGWNTQDSDLVKNVDGNVTMKLDSVKGPGKLSVFLTGNFGSAGQTVFNGAGDSFEVPANTHQHGNWVFTAPGEYTATISWQAKLKNGKSVSTSADLHFLVGNAGASSSEAAPGTSATEQQPKGSVDIATGIVTRPDGSKVRIVGKTASGADCTLSANELAEAQKASAAGKLAHTGFSGVQLAGMGLLALVAGAGVIFLAQRASRKNA